MVFEDKYGYNSPIEKIQASAQNNMATTKRGKTWLWGSNRFSKMGYHYKDKNFEVPKQVCWMVLKPGVDGEGTF